MFMTDIQVETWTYIVADSGLPVDDQRGYTDVLQPCCDLKARVPAPMTSTVGSLLENSVS